MNNLYISGRWLTEFKGYISLLTMLNLHNYISQAGPFFILSQYVNQKTLKEDVYLLAYNYTKTEFLSTKNTYASSIASAVELQKTVLFNDQIEALEKFIEFLRTKAIIKHAKII